METITEISEYEGKRPNGYGTESGFRVRTTEQEIILAISDERDCCESWGYFLSEDDTSKFVGAALRGVSITDTNLTSHEFRREDEPHDERATHLDAGDTLFVNLDTDHGRLQFVAYNAHNGYYSHEARVSSKQLKHEVCL